MSVQPHSSNISICIGRYFLAHFFALVTLTDFEYIKLEYPPF